MVYKLCVAHLSLEAEHRHRNRYKNSDAHGQENRLSAVIATNKKLHCNSHNSELLLAK